LEYKIDKGTLQYRWLSDVVGFDMPIKVSLKVDEYTLVKPSNNWQSVKVDAAITPENFKVERNFYVNTKNTK
jgi:hypothetical protein